MRADQMLRFVWRTHASSNHGTVAQSQSPNTLEAQADDSCLMHFAGLKSAPKNEGVALIFCISAIFEHTVWGSVVVCVALRCAGAVGTPRGGRHRPDFEYFCDLLSVQILKRRPWFWSAVKGVCVARVEKV